MNRIGDRPAPARILAPMTELTPAPAPVEVSAPPADRFPLSPLVQGIREAILSRKLQEQAALLGRAGISSAAAVVLGATAVLAPDGGSAQAAVRGAALGHTISRTASPTEVARALAPKYFPVSGGRYNIGYDPRWQVFDQSKRPLHNSDFSRSATDARHQSGHPANDIFGPKGAPIVAPMNAKVVGIGVARKGGNYIKIQVGNVQMYFAHMGKHAAGLKVGSTVKAGQQLGTLGDTGSARGTAPHLHFQLKVDGRTVDPFPFLMAGHRAQGGR
ncbi:MAG: M23 family metallopeptidase [Myxococcales bacterium]|nr:M23 family metallopeptidase [Myxococcales bacterium]